MKASDIEKFRNHVPFRPFRVRIDGLAETYPVPHPDYFFLNIPKTVCFILDDQGGVKIVDVEHISAVELELKRA